MLKIHKLLDGRAPATEYLPAAAGTYVIGQPTVFVSGKLTAVSSGVGQDTDEGTHYICMANVTAAAGDLIPVVAANENIMWEIPLAAQNTSLVIGASYTLSTDGEGLTSTTDKGAFTVLESDGTAAGALQRGKFVTHVVVEVEASAGGTT